MKILKIALIGIFIFILAVFFAGNLIAKAAIENGVKMITGLPLIIGDLDLAPLKSYIHVKKLIVMNPPGFKDSVMVDLPELYVRYNLPALLTGKIHIPELRVHLEEVSVIKNEQGRLNLNSITALQEAQKKETAPSKGEPGAKKAPAKAPEIQLDRFTLRLGKAYYKEYREGKEDASVKTFHMNLREDYTNITDPNQLVQLIILKVMMNTSIGALTNFNIASLQGSVDDVFTTSSQLATEAAAKAEAFLEDVDAEKLKGVVGTFEGKAGSLTGELKGKTTELAQKFKLPFGKEN